MHVLLIAGGWSNEREVSLSGARNIRAALEELGHTVTDFDPATDLHRLLDAARAHDFCFLNLHGSPGEDGLIQALLDQAGRPYQGAGPKASFLALDKAAAKMVFADAGIPTPDWELVTLPPRPDWAPRLDYPVMLKPNAGGSSLGMALVQDEAALRPGMDAIFAMNQAVLMEALVPGTELTCSVLDGRALPLILIRPKGDAPFFDYHNKYDADGAEEICPAPVDEGLTRRIQELSVRAHQALGIDGYSRADFMVDAAGEPWLLEVNTLPGMTATSLLPRSARAAGMDFPALIAELIRLGLEDRP